jgi:hypothetical protein
LCNINDVGSELRGWEGLHDSEAVARDGGGKCQERRPGMTAGDTVAGVYNVLFISNLRFVVFYSTSRQDTVKYVFGTLHWL